MSQIENKMDDFMPFGGEIRSKYPEDDETVQHAIIDACFAALDDIMFPMDDRGKRPSECQVFFAVQRMYGAEGERDYFLLSDADTIPDEHPFTRDGADWGECGGALACKVLSEPPTLLTFHELAPAGVDMLSRLFSWSSTITAGSISDMVRRASYYQKHLMSNRESFELSHGKPLSEISERPVGADAKELLDKLTSSETVSYFPEFNLLVTTTEYDPLGLHDRDTCVFNVFPSELAYENLFHGFENVVDIPYSGPVVDPIAFQPTFIDSAERDRSNDVDLGSLAMLLSGSDVISTQSVPELLETMADRFGIEPEERTLNANRAQAEECIRTGVPDIQVEIDCTNDDNFIEGTVTVEGESCYFYRPNNSRDTEDYDSVILEPFRPDGFEGDIEEIELPAAIDQNRELAELVVSVATEPYMDPDKAVGREQSIDSLCDEKTEVSESMRYGMEGVGLPMLDASEHLANY